MADIIARGMAASVGLRTVPFVYNADIGLRKWRRAIARQNAGIAEQAKVVVVGDSITEGGLPSNYPSNTLADIWTRRYVGRMQSMFAKRYGDAGVGVIPTFFPAFMAEGGHSLPAWTMTGTWTNGAYTICHDSGNGKSTTVGDTAQISFTGTGVQVLCWGRDTPFYVSIDGGANTTITPTNTNAANLLTAASGLSNASHTLKITNQGTINLVGISPVKQTTGVLVHGMARGGIDATWIYQDSNCYPFMFDLWNPAVTIFALCANDYYNQINIATQYIYYLQQAITYVQNLGSDVMIISIGMRNDKTNPTTPQSSYVSALYDVAMQNNAVYVDMWTRWNKDANYANATLGFLQDGKVHPNDQGHYDIATAIMNVLLEQY